MSHDDGTVVDMETTTTDYGHDPSDRHGNVLAHEGFDRCCCGSKYWERDRCADCGGAWHPDYADTADPDEDGPMNDDWIERAYSRPKQSRPTTQDLILGDLRMER